MSIPPNCSIAKIFHFAPVLWSPVDLSEVTASFRIKVRIY